MPITEQRAEVQPNLESDDEKIIRRLTKRLGYHNPVLLIANALLEREDGVGGMAPLITSLTSNPERHWAEHTVAAWALGRIAMTSDQKEIAARTLGDILTNRQIGAGKRLSLRLWQAAQRWSFMVVLVGGLCSITTHFHNEHRFRLENMLLGMSSFLLMAWQTVPFISMYVDVKRNNRVRKMAAISLGRLHEPDSVGALAKAALDPGRPKTKRAPPFVRFFRL